MSIKNLVLVTAAGLSCGGGLGAGTLTLQSVGVPLFVRIEPSQPGCPEVSTLQGQLNGTALRVDSRGGSTGTLLGGCKAIQLSGTSATEGDASLTVTDGVATWHLDAPGYFAARALTSNGALCSGRSAQVSVTPATDSFDTSPGSSVGFTSRDGGVSFVVKSGVTVSGAVVTFRVPDIAELDDAGVRGTLTVSPGVPLAHVERCEGPASCRAILAVEYRGPVDLRP